MALPLRTKCWRYCQSRAQTVDNPVGKTRHRRSIQSSGAQNTTTCCSCDDPSRPTAFQSPWQVDRRLVILQACSLSLPWRFLADKQEANAQEAPSASAQPAASSLLSQAALTKKFLEVDFELGYPAGFQNIAIPIPILPENGRAPPPNPLKARFETADHSVLLTVIVRESQKIKPTFLQLTDISQFGSPEEAAELVLPRGASLASTQVLKVAVPPKTDSFGRVVEKPPKSYYWVEFFTADQRGALSIAAQRGKVYVCGAAAPTSAWPDIKSSILASVHSFRLRDGITYM